jgi:hypothetical protein
MAQAQTPFVIDSGLAQKIKQKKKLEKAHFEWKQQTEDIIKDAKYVANPHTSRANTELQQGRPLLHTEFENRLKKLLPDVFFLDHPTNLKVKGAYTEHDGQRFYIGAYFKGLMPERSVMKLKEEIVWDRSTTHIDRKNVPEQTFIPGIGLVKKDPNALTPGTELVQIPWGIHHPGWRRILVKICNAGLATPSQIEAVFGSDETPEWAGHLGKRAHTTPW